MFAEERQQLIAGIVTARGRVTVQELADRFTITQETVRRDLGTLEEARFLRRVHGGAVAMDKLSMSEASLTERSFLRQEEKLRIAEAALRLIPADRSASILIDAGTTTELLAEQLLNWRPRSASVELLVITNAVPIAYKLGPHETIQLEMLGGRVRGLTSAAVGPRTTEQLAGLRADLAFIGANGVHANFGLSTPDPVEAAVKAAIVRSARRVVALVDSSKLGQETLVRFAGLDQLDTLITDAEPDAELGAALSAANVEVVIA